MFPLPEDASLTLAVTETIVPTTTVVAVWPATRTFDTAGAVLSANTVAQFPVVSLFGTESRAYTQMEWLPSENPTVDREPVTSSVTSSKVPSWADMTTAMAQFPAP